MTIFDEIAARLPQIVVGVEVSDPVLTIYGDGWGLTLMCPWTLDGPDIATSWESPHMEEEVAGLVGRSLLSVTSDDDVIDPVFHFDGGVNVAVFADTDLDPWTLTLPNFVGFVGRPPN